MRLLPLNPQLHGEPPLLHQLSLLGRAGVHHHAEPRSGESALQGECPGRGWEAPGSPRPHSRGKVTKVPGADNAQVAVVDGHPDTRASFLRGRISVSHGKAYSSRLPSRG